MAKQVLTVKPEMPLDEFLRLWMLDEDLSVTFIRVVPELGIAQRNVIRYLPDGTIEIAQYA
jgi:hypothetical protein